MIFEEAMLFRHYFKSQVSFEEAKELFEAVLKTPMGPVLELGSATGGTTILLIGAAEQVGKMVYSVDPYPEYLEEAALDYTPGLMAEFKKAFKKNILDGPWKDGIVQYNEYLEECIDKLPGYFSVIFIDSCHEFTNVKKEINLLYDKLMIGGRLYIHDIASMTGQLSHLSAGGLIHLVAYFIEDAESRFQNYIIGNVISKDGGVMVYLERVK